MSVDITVPIRNALLARAAITTRLPNYLDSKTVFTRRPVPADAPFPMIIVSPDITLGDTDGIADERPIIERDISIYGKNDTVARYNVVEELGYEVRNMFRRNWKAITVPGWKVVQIFAAGPIMAPVDDEQTVGRLVSLTVQLARL
jgi:hypothetical protein